jgi:hypothetical protein
MADDLFEEMMHIEQFIEFVAHGVHPVNAGIQVGWSPAKTKAMMRDADFADMIQGATERANASVEEALYAKAVAGNVSAIQMWLFNREPDRWRDVKRIEVRSEHKVQIGMVESVKSGVLELLRGEGVEAIQALGAGDIIDGEVVDGDD